MLKYNKYYFLDALFLGVSLLASLDSIVFSSLQSALKASQLRQEVYANNIANANTPGYKRQSVEFENLLQAQLGNVGLTPNGSGTLTMASNNVSDLAGAASFTAVSPVVTTDQATSVSNNGNNVNLTAEMSGIAQNQINYAALVQELNDQFGLLRTAIMGR